MILQDGPVQCSFIRLQTHMQILWVGELKSYQPIATTSVRMSDLIDVPTPNRIVSLFTWDEEAINSQLYSPGNDGNMDIAARWCPSTSIDGLYTFVSRSLSIDANLPCPEDSDSLKDELLEEQRRYHCIHDMLPKLKQYFHSKPKIIINGPDQ